MKLNRIFSKRSSASSRDGSRLESRYGSREGSRDESLSLESLSLKAGDPAVRQRWFSCFNSGNRQSLDCENDISLSTRDILGTQYLREYRLSTDDNDQDLIDCELEQDTYLDFMLQDMERKRTKVSTKGLSTTGTVPAFYRISERSSRLLSFSSGKKSDTE
mmetsp:Transcript_10394/g.31765  ORF Transcript_10394/g.31765 Transcript_10394/m.31765 type:complete len:161 (-) Transcript_10394:493-975(-)|eukprot:CAMPEP_0198730156 /NCGR_PEP_ID=MMETSP1475-20131203/23104_1 /TAXON_ID= ORGANISM="Unidentified sp., Strain CCMP1999" /NCGR_SAMPLE_ID=MMETSP1475 /ASSEMBLY_ACC=CAM_ASM_001111 /LENGTH=160 /DNA_ID=CAMNT_0044492927 /DNA_START=78 /DNA_END=560 /DNA_ORIENTATION=-